MLKNPHTSDQFGPVMSHDHGDDFARAKQLWSDLLELRKKTAAKALELGRELIALKGNVTHGEWEKHAEESIGMPPRTASDYMKLAHDYDALHKCDKSANLADLDDLSISALKRFLANNQNARRQNRRPRISGNGTRKNGKEPKPWDEWTDYFGSYEPIHELMEELTQQLARAYKELDRDDFNGVVKAHGLHKLKGYIALEPSDLKQIARDQEL